MASCRNETEKYRQCLKDSKTTGCVGSKKCKVLAQVLEDCRERYRRDNQIQLEFDGTRIVPNSECQPLNKQVQRCLKFHQSDQSECQNEILQLKDCMTTKQGIVVAPTEGDKIWSDYKKKSK